MTYQNGWDSDGIGQGGGVLATVATYVDMLLKEFRGQLEALGLDYDGVIMKEDQITQQIVSQINPAVDMIMQIQDLLAAALGVPGYTLKGVNSGQEVTEAGNVSSSQWAGGKH